MAENQPVKPSIVGVENGALRVGAKRYSLRHITSVHLTASQEADRLQFVQLLALCCGVVWIAVGVATRSLRDFACGGFVLAAGLTIFVIKRPPPVIYHLAVTSAAGEQHRIDFTDRVACLAFCDQLNDAMRAAGETTFIDARQLHVHPPATPHLR